jgi:hypothetical protein
MSLKLPALALMALVSATVVAPSAAGAAPRGSIVFSDKGNIWLIGADGSGRRKLTRGGGWSSPSQASNGLIVALRRKELHRLDRHGRRIGRPVPLLGTTERKSGNVTIQAGPADLEVSPNGRLAAYWIGTLHQTCNPVTFFCDFRLQDNIAVTRTDRFTPFDRYGLTRDYEEPSWVGNQRVLMFNYGFAADVAIDPLGQGDENLIQLFDDPGGEQLGAGRAPPRAPLMIVLRGPNQESGPQPTMRLYHLRGDGAAVPVCEFTGGKGGGFASPAISPDGRVLAWVEGDGIHVGRVPPAAELAAGSASCARITDKRITGGREPFWGPKGVR